MTALLMPSTQPNEDLDLLAGDYAAMRPATRIERKRAGRRWPQKAFTIVLRSCAGVETVVFPTGLKSGALTAERLDIFIAERGVLRSVAVIAFALRAYPDLLDMLRANRASAGRCKGCNCIWKRDGVFDFTSAESATVAGLIQQSQERDAA